MMINVAAMIQANTTSQIIVEWPRDADLLWFCRLKGEASEACGAAAMISSSPDFLTWMALMCVRDRYAFDEDQLLYAVLLQC